MQVFRCTCTYHCSLIVESLRRYGTPWNIYKVKMIPKFDYNHIFKNFKIVKIYNSSKKIFSRTSARSETVTHWLLISFIWLCCKLLNLVQIKNINENSFSFSSKGPTSQNEGVTFPLKSRCSVVHVCMVGSIYRYAAKLYFSGPFDFFHLFGELLLHVCYFRFH